MCGIAGIVGDETGNVAETTAILEPMCRAVEHRGPDDRGLVVGDSFVFGMQRLAILDADGGRQPMVSASGSSTVAFNGEIYNAPELRCVLEGRGYDFRTSTDSEAGVYAHEEFGAASVERLRGMFAFAVWDSRTRRLLLVRDRIGKKPLYYASVRGGLVFGSELESLLGHPEIVARINSEALDAYFTSGYVPDPLCIFDDGRYVDVRLREHESGRRDHSAQLWVLFVLERWHRTVGAGTGSPTQSRPPLASACGTQVAGVRP